MCVCLWLATFLYQNEIIYLDPPIFHPRSWKGNIILGFRFLLLTAMGQSKYMGWDEIYYRVYVAADLKIVQWPTTFLYSDLRDALI